ncbi:hypothetical protein PHLCEN_2v11055 [Hermanssonia centrifuga]|uniref:Yeast cell wall synthesis Kre9/Knh1-like N-terminal domain-containing protein n=1 Tax=Hermanssonia centrifuga TaxID=98765 RepID=A0A2R6NL37_9APHY|nr:hypothetical protein PHLCEN_2v11055 [Hermanssonia centrifuga]
MFSSTLFATLLAAVAIARADPNPSEPGPGDVYNEGAQCHISWDPDTTGTWKTMNIELMTGSNTGMVHITTVTTLDGTDASKTTFDYACPQVTPNSAIYFYQFTSPDSPDTLWTTRFAIADANGNTTPPSEATEPNGDAIPWGTGALVDPSLAVPAPSKGTTVTAASSSSASSVGTPGSSSANTPAASSGPSTSSPGSFAGNASPSAASPSGLTKVSSSSSSGLPSTSSAANSTGGAVTSPNSAVGALGINSHVMQAAATLTAVAFAFVVAL